MSDNISQLKKVTQLNALLARNSALTTKEYIDLLQEIKKNFVVKLTHQSMAGESKGSVGMLTIIERCHWLLDSVEKTHRIEKEITQTKRILGWEYPEGEAPAEA
jgi:hypothetical protein